MSAVSEDIVREYFESLGFYSYRPVKYQVSARAKRSEEEIDLLLLNSRACARRPLPNDLIMRRADLLALPSAIVSVRGWHTERFTPALIDNNPELCRFASEETMAEARAFLKGSEPIARLLCLPGLPASEGLRDETIQILKSRGVDGILFFRDMLLELARSVDPAANYEKSDLLQFIRIMKSYDLLRDAQLDLFGRRRRRRSAASSVDQDIEAP